MRKEYSTHKIQEVVRQYFSNTNLNQSHLFKSGFDNTSYFIRVDEGDFVLKVYEFSNLDTKSILCEIQVMNYLFNHEFPSPNVLKAINGSLYVQIDGKICILMSYIRGAQLTTNSCSNSIVEQYGLLLAKMDVLLLSFDNEVIIRDNNEFDLKFFMNCREKMQHVEAQYDANILLRIFDEYSEVQTVFNNAKRGIIHNDAVFSNIFIDKEDIVGFIDFSDMAFSPHVQNIAISLCQGFYSQHFNVEQAKLFLHSYLVQNPLNNEEIKIITTLVKARFVNIITEFSSMNALMGIDQERTEFIHSNYIFLQRFLTLNINL